MEESYQGKRQQRFEQVWESINEPSDERVEGRLRGFFDVCKAGGAEDKELKYHMTIMFSALETLGNFDTLAVLLRGFGLDDDEILDFIKSECLTNDSPIGYMMKMLLSSGIKPDARKMLTALNEVNDNYIRYMADLDDLPA